MADNEVIISAISAATTIIVAFLTYLTHKVEKVHKSVNGAAVALAAQVAVDKVIASKKAEQEKQVAVAVEKDKVATLTAALEMAKIQATKTKVGVKK